MIVLVVVLSRDDKSLTSNAKPPGDGEARTSQPAANLGELIALRNQAEKLAIDGNLADAHAKYREFFDKARGHDIKEPGYWNLMERAQLDQDRIYLLLLGREQSDPQGILRPAAAATRAAT